MCTSSISVQRHVIKVVLLPDISMLLHETTASLRKCVMIILHGRPTTCVVADDWIVYNNTCIMQNTCHQYYIHGACWHRDCLLTSSDY